MKRRPKHLSLATLALLAGPLVAATAFDQPVPARIVYPERESAVVLLGIEDRQLVFRDNTSARATGIAYLRLAELRQRRAVVVVDLPLEVRVALELAKTSGATSDLPLLREQARPMVKFMAMGGLAGNMCGLVTGYLDTLTRADLPAEFLEIARQIDFSEADPSLLAALARHLEVITPEGATFGELLGPILANDSWSAGHLERLMDMADRFRERRWFAEAQRLYQLLQTYEGSLATRAALWHAYSAYYNGEPETPGEVLANLPEIEPHEESFSLYRMILAKLSLRAEDASAAMRSAAEGKAYAAVNLIWYPELLYILGQAYEALGEPEAARYCYREASVLFPDSPWATDSLASLQRLATSSSNLPSE